MDKAQQPSSFQQLEKVIPFAHRSTILQLTPFPYIARRRNLCHCTFPFFLITITFDCPTLVVLPALSLLALPALPVCWLVAALHAAHLIPR